MNDPALISHFILVLMLLVQRTGRELNGRGKFKEKNSTEKKRSNIKNERKTGKYVLKEIISSCLTSDTQTFIEPLPCSLPTMCLTYHVSGHKLDVINPQMMNK